MGINAIYYSAHVGPGISARMHQRPPALVAAGPAPRPVCSSSCRPALSAGEAASGSGGEAHWRGPGAAEAVGPPATAPGEAAWSSGGVAHHAWPVPSRLGGTLRNPFRRPAASCCGGWSCRLLAWRQVPRVACRTCRHGPGVFFIKSIHG